MIRTFLAVIALLLMVCHANAQTNTQAGKVCTTYATATVASATDTNLVTPGALQVVYICDISFSASAADNIYLESNTSGGSCNGTLAQLGNTWYLAQNGLKSITNVYQGPLKTVAGSGVCLHTSTSGPVSVTIFYSQN